ncbi:MAG TPA: S8 family serine peptidase, partial [Candidatus Obscuribacterales bacterium]
GEGDRYILIDEETREILEEYLTHIDFNQVYLFRRDDGEIYTPQNVFELSLQYPNVTLVSELSGFFPIYNQSDYEIIPTPLRLNVVSQYSGRGITIAFLDSGFYPHPDLTMPNNRVLAYVNVPHPDLDDFAIPQDNSWHGMQTSVSAVGNGYLSNGLYKSIAYNANIVLIKASDREGRIKTEYMIKGLKWVLEHHQEYNIRIVNISLGESVQQSYLDNALDQMAEALVQAGITVVVAAGNDGHSVKANRITPPASAPSVITVGGFDDKNRLSRHYYDMYHSSYGPTIDGLMKPELIAPGIWVAAPILPGTDFYRQAELLSNVVKLKGEALVTALKDNYEDMPFGQDIFELPPEKIHHQIRQWLRQQKIVGMHYQHVDGTSFSSPIVCSIISQMLEANPDLNPRRIKQILCSTTDKIFNIAIEKQGHGLIHPRKCVKEAENDRYRRHLKRQASPYVNRRKVIFYYRDKEAQSVALAGDFTDWKADEPLQRIPDTNTWMLEKEFPFKGIYAYKLVVDGERWINDPESENVEPDGYGGFNTRLQLYLD